LLPDEIEPINNPSIKDKSNDGQSRQLLED